MAIMLEEKMNAKLLESIQISQIGSPVVRVLP